jgi:hypothetical protein
MNGHELCAVYLAIKLHFSQEKYNFFMGSGKAKISIDAFQKRKDKYLFHKLSRKLSDEEVVPFLVANFVHSGDTWTRTLLSDGAEDVYNDWKKKIESMSYVFENDLRKIMGEDHKLLTKCKSFDGKYPEVLSLYMQGDITLETLVILNIVINFIDHWDKEISDTIVYPKIAMKMRKYQPFFSIDLDKMKNIIKKCLTS